MNNPFDRLQIIFIAVAALATIGIALLCNSIIDRSAEHVKKVQQTNLDDKTGSLSMDIVHIAEEGTDVLHDRVEQQRNAYFSDVTITAKQINDLRSRTYLLKMKILRCDYEPDAFDPIKDLKVRYISMSDTLVTKRMMDAMSQMPNLTHLDFFRCNVEDNALDNIAQSKIIMFKFRKCGPEINGGLTTARQFKSLARMERLQYLDLSKGDFETDALQQLRNAQPLLLNLTHSNVSPKDLEAIKKMPRLQFLELGNDKLLSCKDLPLLAGGTSLKHVRLGGDLSGCPPPPQLAAMFDPRSFKVPINLIYDVP